MLHNVVLSLQTAAVAAVKENGVLLTRRNLSGAAVAVHNVVLYRQTETVAAVDVIENFVI